MFGPPRPGCVALRRHADPGREPGLAGHDGREAEARRVLVRVRSRDHDIDGEIDEIRALGDRTSNYRELLQPDVRKLVVIGVLLAVFQGSLGSTRSFTTHPHSCTKPVSEFRLPPSQRGVRHCQRWDDGGRHMAYRQGGKARPVDRRYRRHVVALFIVAATFAVSGNTLGHTAAIVAVVGLAVYTGSFAIGLGPVFWLLISEIYPARIRGKSMSVADGRLKAYDFVVAISFLTLLNTISNAGTFFLLGFFSLVALTYFWRRVPETKGLSLRRDRARDG